MPILVDKLKMLGYETVIMGETTVAFKRSTHEVKVYKGGNLEYSCSKAEPTGFGNNTEYIIKLHRFGVMLDLAVYVTDTARNESWRVNSMQIDSSGNIFTDQQKYINGVLKETKQYSLYEDDEVWLMNETIIIANSKPKYKAYLYSKVYNKKFSTQVKSPLNIHRRPLNVYKYGIFIDDKNYIDIRNGIIIPLVDGSSKKMFTDTDGNIGCMLTRISNKKHESIIVVGKNQYIIEKLEQNKNDRFSTDCIVYPYGNSKDNLKIITVWRHNIKDISEIFIGDHKQALVS